MCAAACAASFSVLWVLVAWCVMRGWGMQADNSSDSNCRRWRCYVLQATQQQPNHAFMELLLAMKHRNCLLLFTWPAARSLWPTAWAAWIAGG